MGKADSFGDFPIHEAAKEGNLELLRTLLDAGDDVNRNNTQPSRAETPLAAAVSTACFAEDEDEERRALACISLLLERGAAPNIRQGNGSAPLSIAILFPQVRKLLLAKGADVNAADERGWRPIHVAAFNGSVDAVETLIQRRADLKAPTREGETPLMLAAKARAGDGAAVQRLLRQHGTAR
jgi:ankyrin repeat protein